MTTPQTEKQPQTGRDAYDPPKIFEIGTLYDLTREPNKDFGSGDTFLFQNQPTTVTSA